ncbi:hypothetical protein, partial [Vibrio harveyi]|uniref:hypothetical protein n=1 Tax=Vibrio harveyi TaxID=669 RepID=UPI00211A3CBD
PSLTAVRATASEATSGVVRPLGRAVFSKALFGVVSPFSAARFVHVVLSASAFKLRLILVCIHTKS